MGFVSYQLGRVATFARWTAWISIVFGIVIIAMGIIAFLVLIDEKYVVRPTFFLAFLLIPLVLIPSFLLIYFARKLDNGAVWAYFPIAIISLTSLSIMAFRMIATRNVLPVLFGLPTLILVGCCINAYSDVRDHYRQLKRKRQPRGFEPIVSTEMSKVKPPPPARGR